MTITSAGQSHDRFSKQTLYRVTFPYQISLPYGIVGNGDNNPDCRTANTPTDKSWARNTIPIDMQSPTKRIPLIFFRLTHYCIKNL